MRWHDDWVISWERGYRFVRSLFHHDPLAQQVLFIPCCPHLPTPSPSTSDVRPFYSLGDISRSVAPIPSILEDSESPRRPLSNGTKVHMIPFGGSRSGHLWMFLSSSPPTSSTSHPNRLV
jgi:hypothetical protein